MNKEPKNVTRLDVLGAIRDASGLDLFNSIATDRRSNNNIDSAVKISRKQYYSRLSKLIKADMIKRKSGKYLLTPFGAVIYGVQLEFGKAVNEHLKSKLGKSTIIN